MIMNRIAYRNPNLISTAAPIFKVQMQIKNQDTYPDFDQEAAGKADHLT